MLVERNPQSHFTTFFTELEEQVLCSSQTLGDGRFLPLPRRLKLQCPTHICYTNHTSLISNLGSTLIKKCALLLRSKWTGEKYMVQLSAQYVPKSPLCVLLGSSLRAVPTTDLNPNMISSWRRWASSSMDRMASVSTASQGRKRLLRLFFSVRTTYKGGDGTLKSWNWVFIGAEQLYRWSTVVVTVLTTSE